MIPVTSMPLAMPQEEVLTHMPTYTQMGMNPPLPAQVQKTREQSYGPVMHYDRNGIPLNQVSNRHSSMPAYMEYSPAPSFVSSHFDDYSTRGLSFEPITPPQHSMPQVTEATSYMVNEDTGLYTAIPDAGMSHFYNPLMHMHQPTSANAPQYPSMIRPLNQSSPAAFPALEGSPTYKQRRRRSSLTMQANTVHATPHAVHRPSDLRHSIPNSESEQTYHDSPASVHNVYNTPSRQKELMDPSRHVTPVDDAAQMHSASLHTEDFTSIPSDQPRQYRPMPAAVTRTANGVFRRARSATITELGGPYPQKSHSCPIPMCGRLFKRLEHLKRHVRTHTSERPYVCSLCNKAFSRSDNLAQHQRTHNATQDGSLSQEDLEEVDEEIEAQDDADAEAAEAAAETSYISMPGMPPTSMPSDMHQHQLPDTQLPTHIDMRSLSRDPETSYQSGILAGGDYQ